MVDGIHYTACGVGDAINSQRVIRISYVSVITLTIEVAHRLISGTIQRNPRRPNFEANLYPPLDFNNLASNSNFVIAFRTPRG